MSSLAGQGGIGLGGSSLKSIKHRAWRYGLTLDQLVGMYRQQRDRCAICLVERPLVVDHDHRCCPEGKYGDNPSGRVSCGRCVRALICFDCNTMLYKGNDDPGRFGRAKDYLEHYLVRLWGERGAQGMAIGPGGPNPASSDTPASRARASSEPFGTHETRSRRLSPRRLGP